MITVGSTVLVAWAGWSFFQEAVRRFPEGPGTQDVAEADDEDDAIR